MAWTFVTSGTFGIGDNGTQAGPSVSGSVTSLGQQGDLIVVIGQFKGNSTLSLVSDTSSGGDNLTWTALAQVANGTTSVGRMFWAIWGAAGRQDMILSVAAGTTALSGVVIVFRPTNTSNTIALDPPQSSGTISTASATVTLTGQTTTSNSTVTVATWCTEDDNTWGTLTGAGWSKTGLGAQFRNLAGTDQSNTQAYNISTSAGTLANVSQTMGTTGIDAGFWIMNTWKETASGGGGADILDPMGMMGFFGI